MKVLRMSCLVWSPISLPYRMYELDKQVKKEHMKETMKEDTQTSVVILMMNLHHHHLTIN